MENRLNYTRLPNELFYTSVEEIVDSYNSFNLNKRQYRDLIFVHNIATVTDLIEYNEKEFFCIIKTINHESPLDFQTFGNGYTVAQPFINNKGITIFNRLYSETKFYCEFALFSFK